MFRTKKDVDRHVQDIFRKIKSEDERNNHCYSIAKFYFQVGDHESARRYISMYLEKRDHVAAAHRLYGDILEALGQKEASLAEYKVSLELNPKQDGIVLKVCQLLADPDVGIDVVRAKYWAERADRSFPHHPTIFQLKEKILTLDKTAKSSEDLESLIKSELSARPADVQLKIKLMKHYMEKQKCDEAYAFASATEDTNAHRDSIVWYQTLCELLSKYKTKKSSDSSYWIFYASTLERFAALSLRAQGALSNKDISEAMQAIFTFDQILFEIKNNNLPNIPSVFFDHMMEHMWGQLHYHLACLVLRKALRERGTWNEATVQFAPLLLTAMHVRPVDPAAPWVSHLKERTKGLVNIWHREAAYRCSQAGHVLQDFMQDDVKSQMDKISTFCTKGWRERLYKKIFTNRYHQQIGKSLFSQYMTEASPALRLFSHTELTCYDEIAESVYPRSLHHQVWLGIKNTQPKNDSSPHPHQYSHIFPELQFSVYNLNQAAPETLSRLDVDVFLNISVLCASSIVEQQQRRSFLVENPTLPADLTSPLCTVSQEKWWSCAYDIYSKKDRFDGDIGELRQELQRGLEVVRCIGNHGLSPQILVHLARIFQHRVKVLRNKDKQHPDIVALEARSELFWFAAIPLLERLLNDQTIRYLNTKLFEYEGKEMTNAELVNALEEGKLLIAEKKLRNGQDEQAIEILKTLRSPDASNLQGKIFKKLADDLISLPQESVTSEIRAQCDQLLMKARNCFHLTLDRLRSPDANPTHPLNAEIYASMSDVENEITNLNPEMLNNSTNNNDFCGTTDESFSSAHSREDREAIDNSIYSPIKIPNFSETSLRNSTRNPISNHTSTPNRRQNVSLDPSLYRAEARPSSERLDAQIRQLMSRSNMIQQVNDRNESLIDSNKLITEKLMELTKELSDLKIEFKKQQVSITTAAATAAVAAAAATAAMNNSSSQSALNRSHVPEEMPEYREEDYADYYAAAAAQIAQAQPINPALAKNTYSGLPGYCSPNKYLIPLAPTMYPLGFPGAHAYPGAAAQPPPPPPPTMFPPRVFPTPPVRPMLPGSVYQPMGSLEEVQDPGMMHRRVENMQMLQSNYPQITDLDVQGIPASNHSVIRDAPVNQSLPVNVVITSSDTLPTTVPETQTTLSVTIPAQHRLGGITSSASVQQPIPHNYQISMPSQANIPTTVNLPPLFTTLTMTAPNMSGSFNEKPKLHNSSIVSTSSSEPEHDPIPDFQPVIPLPAEVDVTTGEENETRLFCKRAKLFRFVEKEWKERGVGDVKLLRNAEGKVRLLMRRDQVLKICANHLLTKDMELSPMANNDKAYVWVANDFADEQVRLEKLCIRFKTSEEAQEFKKSFDQARDNLPAEKKTPEPKTKGSKKKESDKKKAQEKPIVEGKTSKQVSLGGFSFIEKPVVQVKKSEAKEADEKPKEAPKPSPFAGFSFGKIDDKSSAEIVVPSSKFVWDLKANSNDDHVSTLRKSQVNRTVFLELNATLKSPEGQHLKDIAAGQVQIVGDSNGNSFIFLAKGEQVFCDHTITADMSFMQTNDTVHWTEQDTQKKFALVFQSANQANQFCKFAVERRPVRRIREEPQIFELFKPAANSWECTGCYVRNDGSSAQCISCRSPRPSAPAKSKNSTEKVPLSEMFKPAQGSWECTECYTRNDASKASCVSCESPNPSSKSGEAPAIAEVSKPALGSWQCAGCNMRNDTSKTYCVTCDSPKDPSMPPKPKSTGFNVGGGATSTTKFSFGVTPEVPKDAAKLNDFVFQKPNYYLNSEENKNLANSSEGNFVFGNQPQRPTTPPNSSSFSFGSPGKSFNFQFQARSPVKSPGGVGGEVSEDEVAESDDIYFAPVVPLPDKVDVKTGEENENVLYSHRAKLFRFDSATKEWKERGLGDIKLLEHSETKKMRLIMRRDQILKLCLNHVVTAELEVKPKDDKTWLWSAADYSDGEIEYSQFACRFKNSEIAQDFKKALEKAVKLDAVPEKSKSNEEKQEIEILYEAKVSADDKAAALKLQLPENFFNYKNKEDCPGCVGCQEPAYEFEKSVETPKPVTKETPPAPALFGSGTTAFGTSFFGQKTGEEKSSGFVFGNLLTQPKPATTEAQSFENLKICSPQTTDTSLFKSATPNLFSGQTPSATPVFAATSFVFQPTGNATIATEASKFSFVKSSTSEAPIFSSLNSKTSNETKNVDSNTKSPEGITIRKSIFIPSIPNVEVETKSAESNAKNSMTIFGGKLAPSTDAETKSVISSTSTPTTSILKAAAKPTSLFGNTGLFGKAAMMTKNPNIFGGKPEGEVKTQQMPSFLAATENAVSFSALAAQNNEQPAFKPDPNFKFEGAGTSVFGVKSPAVSTRSKKKEMNSTSLNESNNVDDDEKEEEEDQEHDPHFEPIVPLPDAIEVRTGEEDEEKVFAERGKLYRFDKNTKEWKERGVGEMRILHHVAQGSYRLLLRREQVHKVVCNILLTADLQFSSLNSSDRAWLWAGMNYAEEDPAIEKLAIKFKTPELAAQFKSTVDKAQDALREKQSSNQEKQNNVLEEENSYNPEADNYDEYGEEVEEEIEEEEDDESIMFVERATVSASDGEAWTVLAEGDLHITYDSSFYGARIKMKLDETGEDVINTVISMETQMQVVGKECMWTAIDYAKNPPMQRNIKATFASEMAASNMYRFYSEGQEFARQVGISEELEYIPISQV